MVIHLLHLFPASIHQRAQNNIEGLLLSCEGVFLRADSFNWMGLAAPGYLIKKS